MTLALSAIHTALPEPAEGAAAPEWLHLIPAGTFSGSDGRGPYRLADPAAVIRASMAAGKLPLDVNHSTDLAAPRGEGAPAVGWIVELQARPDGLWGRVEWNESGLALMADRAYRGISPVFEHSKAKPWLVTRVLRAALTNVPNLTQLKTLHSTQGNTMDLTALRAALGLPETADEAAILAAITGQAATIASHGQQLAAIATAAGVSAETSGEALVTAIQAARAAPPSELVAMQAQLTELRTARARDKAEAFIDGAIRAGKPIVANRERLIASHMADPEGAEALVNAMPSINAGGQVVRHAAGDNDGDEPDALTVEMARKTGMDPKKVAAHRAELRKQREERAA